jgi:hypothetical protein
MILLDCHSSASLNFSEQRKKALEIVSKGQRIEWHFDFGFFDRLLFPLSDPMQTGSHRHAIDHFMKSLWLEFESYTNALCLYRGPFPDPFEDFVVYINLLADFFKEELPFSIHFDKRVSLYDQVIKTTPENFSRFSLLIEGSPPPFRTPHAATALLIPLKEKQTPEILAKLKRVIESRPFERFVYEAYLTNEWEGVSELYLLSDSLHGALDRKLAGFEAAEGIIHKI